MKRSPCPGRGSRAANVPEAHAFSVVAHTPVFQFADEETARIVSFNEVGTRRKRSARGRRIVPILLQCTVPVSVQCIVPFLLQYTVPFLLQCTVPF